MVAVHSPASISLSLSLSLSPLRSPGDSRGIPGRYRPVDYNAATINKFVSDKRGNRKGPYISEPHKATHGEQYFSTVAMRETGSNFNRPDCYAIGPALPTEPRAMAGHLQLSDWVAGPSCNPINTDILKYFSGPGLKPHLVFLREKFCCIEEIN